MRFGATVAALAVAMSAGAGVAGAGAAAPPPPRSIVVALGLTSPRLQSGVVVGGREVILARGFEVELARILARRLGGRVDRFVYVPSTPRLLASSLSGWHLALGGIASAPGPRAAGDVSRPYLTTDVAVVARRGLDVPKRLADLRGALVCAVRGSEPARVLATRIRPRRPPLYVVGPARLQAVVRTGACDAALVSALEAGSFVEGHRGALGPIVGRIEHGPGVAMLVRRGSGLDVAAVNRELDRLARDGTLGRLARTWLGVDPAGLRVLR
jgi:ABC-type amino acid transport substrate-binding protein